MVCFISLFGVPISFGIPNEILIYNAMSVGSPCLHKSAGPERTERSRSIEGVTGFKIEIPQFKQSY